MKNNKIIFGIFALVLVSIVAIIPKTASADTLGDPEIVGNVTATAPESAGLSDQELIDLFNAKSTDGSDIIVNQDHINYTKPGTYQVDFYLADNVNTKNPYEGWLTGFLTLTDVAAQINVESTQKTIVQNSIVDYKELFGVEAHEITTDDLTDQVVVDDSAVNLSVAGNYPVIFSVTDSEGNIVSKEVTLTVQSGKPVVTGDYYTIIDSSDVELTDAELIDLFNVESSEGEIVVDQSTVDYSTPYEYHISFKSTNSYGTTTLQVALIIQ